MNYNSYNSDNATGTIEVGILGSTGSIGTQTLDIVSEYPARFRASLLTAGKNWRLLAEQARKYLPRRVVIADETAYPYLRDALSDLPVEVAAGAGSHSRGCGNAGTGHRGDSHGGIQRSDSDCQGNTGRQKDSPRQQRDSRGGR